MTASSACNASDIRWVTHVRRICANGDATMKQCGHFEPTMLRASGGRIGGKYLNFQTDSRSRLNGSTLRTRGLLSFSGPYWDALEAYDIMARGITAAHSILSSIPFSSSPPPHRTPLSNLLFCQFSQRCTYCEGWAIHFDTPPELTTQAPLNPPEVSHSFNQWSVVWGCLKHVGGVGEN